MPTATHSHRRPRVPRRPFFPLAALCLAAALAAPRAAASGFDTGRDAAGAVALADALALTPEQASWLRIRGLGETRTEGDWRGATVDGTRAALGELRRRGFKLCVLLIWDSPVWKSGVRPGPGNRFPIDLREARERARQVAATYGDLVDAWEIYNEPDIGFVADNPEHYAAFFKAVAHGLREGRAAGGGFPECPAPRVVMAALAMPPGPFFQRLAANDFLNHTDALNYHYYGYPEDFADVHRQFQNALAAGVPRRPGRPPLREKHLPVFITEYGYGLLDATARGTVAGRVHQWRFFAGVAPQVTALGVEAPMAFLLPPYLEHELGEFGLTAVPGSGGGLSYTPGDFGLDAAPSWMERPGADGGVTPALAFLLDHAAKNPARPRALATRARPASPFVVDLVAGGDFVQDKQAGAYRVRDAVATTQKAVAVLYNFSNATVTGRLLATLSGGAGSVAIGNDNLPSPGVAGVSVTLSPDERREVSLVLSVPEKVHRPNALELRFVPDGPSSPFVRRHSRKQPFAFRSVAAAPVAGVFSTLLYPSADCMRPRLLFDFA
ncbi:MAG: glycoside hydrolase family 5 protein, partial [Opitutaceae bacterium]|nr:glycoside hydrolase family 5 protein [Opitutaceae bacterium]